MKGLILVVCLWSFSSFSSTVCKNYFSNSNFYELQIKSIESLEITGRSLQAIYPVRLLGGQQSRLASYILGNLRSQAAAILGQLREAESPDVLAMASIGVTKIYTVLQAAMRYSTREDRDLIGILRQRMIEEDLKVQYVTKSLMANVTLKEKLPKSSIVYFLKLAERDSISFSYILRLYERITQSIDREGVYEPNKAVLAILAQLAIHGGSTKISEAYLKATKKVQEGYENPPADLRANLIFKYMSSDLPIQVSAVYNLYLQASSLSNR